MKCTSRNKNKNIEGTERRLYNKIMKNNKQQNIFWYMHKQKLQIKENGLLPVKGVDNEKIAIYHVIVFYCNFFLSDPHCWIYFVYTQYFCLLKM